MIININCSIIRFNNDNETSVNDILPEKLLCYAVKKDNQDVSIVICVLLNYVLFLDTICLIPILRMIKVF